MRWRVLIVLIVVANLASLSSVQATVAPGQPAIVSADRGVPAGNVHAIRATFTARSVGEAPAALLMAAKPNFGGGGVLRGLAEGSNQQRVRTNDGGGNLNRKPSRQYGNDDFYNNNNNNNYSNWPTQQYKPVPTTPAAPAAPAKPKPTTQGPLAIQEFLPNRLPNAPTVPPGHLRNALIKELDSVLGSEVETIDTVLRAADMSEVATRALLARARRDSGSGLDTELVGELSRAVFAKDATKVDEVGLALGLPGEPLETVVLATFLSELRKTVEDASDPTDRRATQDVRKCVGKFQKKLRRATTLDKNFRDGLTERLETILALLEARDELQRASESAKEASGAELTWPDTAVWVLATPDLKSGTVYYITSNLVVAGTNVPGGITLLKSTVAAAFGCLGLEAPRSATPGPTAVDIAKRVSFVNPPGSPKDFAFQLNGYDYSLKPGNMLWFTNSDDRKVETFRYGNAEGQQTSGFDLKEKDGSLINDACFVLNWNGSAWTCARRLKISYVARDTERGTAPATYIFNDTEKAIKFTFNRTEQTLAPQTGVAFPKVDDWHIRFPTTKPVTKDQPKTGERTYLLATGKSFRLTQDGEGLDLKVRPPDELEIDNRPNALGFSYRLANQWHTVGPFEQKKHTFATPPTLALAYDDGTGTLVSTAATLGRTYTVGLSSALQFVASDDAAAATPVLDAQRQAFLERDKQLLARAEQMADQRRERQTAAAASESPTRGDPPPQAKPEPKPSQPARTAQRNLPTAHLLSIGIAKYGDDKFNLRFSDHDATEFAETFRQAAGDLFADVSAKVLTNDEATKAHVDEALNELTKDVDDGDLAVLFFSAHGRSDADRYYLCPHDFNPENLVSTAVKYSDIVDTVRTLTRRDCRVLILADTCYSAALSAALGAKSTSSGTLLDAHKAAIHDKSNGRSSCMLLASSGADQESFERDEWQHGAFTKALLDVINDPTSDEDEDGLLTANELAQGVRRQVRKLTNNKQRSHQDWPPSDKDFPLLKSAQ